MDFDVDSRRAPSAKALGYSRALRFTDFDIDSGRVPSAEALGYSQRVRFADRNALLCLTQNPYVIFSLFKTLPVLACKASALT